MAAAVHPNSLGNSQKKDLRNKWPPHPVHRQGSEKYQGKNPNLRLLTISLHRVCRTSLLFPESGVGDDAERPLVHVGPRADDADAAVAVGEVVLPPRLDLHLAREHVPVEPDADELLGERLLAGAPQVQVPPRRLGVEEPALLQAEVVQDHAHLDGQRVPVVDLGNETDCVVLLE